MAPAKPISHSCSPARPRAAAAPAIPLPATTMALRRLILQPAADALLTLKATRMDSASFGPRMGPANVQALAAIAQTTWFGIHRFNHGWSISSGRARPPTVIRTTTRPALSSAAVKALPTRWDTTCFSLSCRSHPRRERSEIVSLAIWAEKPDSGATFRTDLDQADTFPCAIG